MHKTSHFARPSLDEDAHTRMSRPRFPPEMQIKVQRYHLVCPYTSQYVVTISRPVDGQLQQGTKPVEWIHTSVPRIRANFDAPFLNIRVQPPAMTPYTLTENNMTPLQIDLRYIFVYGMTIC